MLCESRLWSMTYGGLDEGVPLPPEKVAQGAARNGLQRTAAALVPAPTGRSSVMTKMKHRSFGGPALLVAPTSPLRAQAQRHASPEVEIPCQDPSGGDAPFQVPSICQSFCQNYSDLHIGGDQVLPLSANEAEFLVCTDSKAAASPLLPSCDVLPAPGDSLSEQTSRSGKQCLPRGGSTRWRQGSGRNQSFLFQGSEGPFSNSLLNRYLEHKLVDLYQQYMLDNMTKGAGGGGGGGDPTQGHACSLLGSELVLTSLDQITLQLSREGNLEAGFAKDMVISCLLRVASDMQSNEISTPLLQFSSEDQPSKDQPSKDQRASEPPVKEML